MTDRTARGNATRMDTPALAAIIDNCRDYVAVATDRGRLLYVNPYGREMVGLEGDPADVPVGDYYTEETFAVLLEEALPAVEEHGGWEGRTVWRHLQTDEPIPVHQSIFAVPHPTGDDDTVYATIARDLREVVSAHVGQLHELSVAAVAITSSLSLHEALEETARRARQIVGTHLAVVSLAEDADLGETVAVDRSGKYGAYTDDHIVASVLADGDVVPLQGLLVVPLLGHDAGELGEIALSDKEDGEFDDGDEAILRQLAQLAAAAVERARLLGEQAEHRAAAFRDDLLAGITHDMQTPLTTILGVADLLEEHLDGDHLKAAHALSRQARRLRSLVQQFLDFSRLEAGRPLDLRREPVRLAEVVTEAVTLFSQHRDIEVDLAPDLPPVVADADRLVQVLSNLLSNAVKYTDDGISVTAAADADHIRIEVADRGPGIPADEVDAIFERFTRGSEHTGGGGTGLGLYIARALTEAQGGTLTADTREARGSVFRITLPTATAD